MVDEFSRKSAETDPTTDRSGEVLNMIKTIVLFVFIAVFLRGSVVEAFKIPSSSMEPTLQIGDHILVSKLSYGLRLPFKAESLKVFGTPDRKDIVVFTLPDDLKTADTDESDTNIIKRVIGLPGDEVSVRGTTVMINGKRLEGDDDYARWLAGGVRDFGPARVPEGRVFLMGDNRDFSRDARYWDDPFLPISRIKGRAFIIYWNSQYMFERLFTILH